MNRVKRALEAIVANSKEKALNWAVGYAEYGITISDPHELRVQCLYVLNNITHWRGEVAKEVRATLKAYIKET